MERFLDPEIIGMVDVSYIRSAQCGGQEDKVMEVEDWDGRIMRTVAPPDQAYVICMSCVEDEREVRGAKMSLDRLCRTEHEVC